MLKQKKVVAIKRYTKQSAQYLSQILNRFTNNLLIKSLMTAMMQIIPFIIVGALFLLIAAIPQAIMQLHDKENFQNVISKTIAWTNWSSFTSNVWNFTGSFLGVLVTAQLGYVMINNLNPRLRFDKQIPAIFCYITMLISYILMAMIPAAADVFKFGEVEYGRIAVLWGSRGLLPGIIMGWTLPWIFYFCYKYNITLKMPPNAPQIVTKAFTPIVPIFFCLFLTSGISLLFDWQLGSPLFIWIFSQVSSKVVNSINDTWNLAMFYSFIKPMSWFVGVQPNWTGAIFAPISLSNLTENASLINSTTPLYAWSNGKTHVFVENTIDAISDAGGAGATFMVPFLYILFAKSTQLKTVGKNSSVTIWFQVNEPLLFGAGMILNPIYLIPYLLTPMLTTIPIMAFWQAGILNPGASIIPWSTPWFFRAIVPNFNQSGIYYVVMIAFVLQTFLYLPFVKIHDNLLLKEEMKKNVKQHYITGFQIIRSYIFNFDHLSFKEYFTLKKNNKNNSEIIKEAKAKLVIAHNNNINNVLEIIYANKLEKLRVKLDNKMQNFNQKFNNLIDKHNNKIEKYKNKIDLYTKNQMEIYNHLTPTAKKKIHNLQEKIHEMKAQFVFIKTNERKEFLSKYLIQKETLELEKNYKSYLNTFYKPQRFYLFTKIHNMITNKQFVKNEKYKAILQKELNTKIQAIKMQSQNWIKAINNGDNVYENYFELIDAKNTKDKIKTNTKKIKEKLKVICLCIGAGSSSILANNFNKANRLFNLNYEASAFALGNHQEAFQKADIIILSPQIKSNYESLKKQALQNNSKILLTSAKEYIDLSNNVESVKAFVNKNF